MLFRALPLIYLSVLLFVSLLAFVLYGFDKKVAGTGAGRIPEKVLLGLAALGGAVGAFVGRILFRHKTNKAYFSLVIILSLVLQIGTLVLLIRQGGGKLL